jgi:hypothetical protein
MRVLRVGGFSGGRLYLPAAALLLNPIVAERSRQSAKSPQTRPSRRPALPAFVLRQIRKRGEYPGRLGIRSTVAEQTP